MENLCRAIIVQLTAAFVFTGAASAVLTSVGAADTETTLPLGTTVWCDDEDTIVVNGPIVVPSGALLSILPGCIVRGQPRDAAFSAVAPLTGAPGSLQVYQGGTIIADGTATDPIIFTTAAVDVDDDGVADMNAGFFPRQWTVGDGENNFYDDTPATNPLAPLDGVGDGNVALWGGILVAGVAPTTLPGVGIGIGQIQGTSAQLYGCDSGIIPCDPADDSGVLNYVSVRYGGGEIGVGNDVAGITFAGVGNRTVCDHVEVYASEDDGIEMLGGTVDCTNVLLGYIGDDALDLTQGYRGTIQHALVLSPFFEENDSDDFGSASGDRGVQWGETDSDAAICNLTIVGNAGDGEANPAMVPEGGNRGISMDDLFAGDLANSMVVNTVTAAGLTIVGSPPFCPAHALFSSTFADSPSSGACVGSADTNGNSLTVFTGAEKLVNENPFWDPQGTIANGRGKLAQTLGAPIDPRPMIVENDGVDPTTVGCVDATATYRGAFGTTSGPMFTDDWTALSLGGILPMPEPGRMAALGCGAFLLVLLARCGRSGMASGKASKERTSAAS